MYGYPVIPIPLDEETTFTPLCILSIFSINRRSSWFQMNFRIVSAISAKTEKVIRVSVRIALNL